MIVFLCTGIGLETWDTQSVTDLSRTFYNALAMEANIGSWDTS